MHMHHLYKLQSFVSGTIPESMIFWTIGFVQVKGIEESDVTPGFVLCCPANPIKTGKVFDAQVSGDDAKKWNRQYLQHALYGTNFQNFAMRQI